MKFKKLEIYGFKSFADKLTVEFGEGITGIVGPNGCGKSNVADSIRWVLGEQRAKLLRGNSMTDVIFSGTEKRKSMSFCEVLLYFDNTDRLFPTIDYSEVVISRKLYRSGESQYCINGNVCRLKEITDILRDGSMGREGYSIIGQGRIDELLSAKPEDRRAIFEEAAGISKFKARKRESENKLARTQDNIARITDILTEKAKQLEPLTKQAETAQKYLTLRDRLRFNEINSYIYQYDSASRSKEVIGERVKAVTEELELRQREYETLIEDYRKTREDGENVDKDIESLRENLVELTVGIANQAGEIRLEKQRVEHLNENNESLKEENVRLTALIDQDVKSSEKLSSDKIESERKYAALRNEYEKVNERYIEVNDALMQNADEVESTRRAELEAVDKLTDIKSNMARLLAEKDGLEARVGEYGERIVEAKSRLKENEPKIAKFTADTSSLSAQKEEAAKELKGFYEKNNEQLFELKRLGDEIDKLSNQYHTSKGQFHILKDMKEAYDAYNNSVRNLLVDAKKNEDISKRIEGVVAELTIVPPMFEIAIETALGAAVQNVVTRTDEDAKYVVNYLKKNKRGRVTFLPINTVKARKIDSKFYPFIKGEGCFGIASDIISYDEKYRRIFESLLGGTVIVDNIDRAIELAKETGFSFKIVSLDGDVISPQGSISGGSRVGDRSVSNIFTHERELKETREQTEKIGAELEAKTERKASLTALHDELSDNIKECGDKVHAIEIELASKLETLTSLNAESEQYEKNLIALEYQYNRDNERISAIDKDITSVGELEEIIRTARAKASENNAEKQVYLDNLRADYEKLRAETLRLTLESNRLENEIAGFETELNRIKSEVFSREERIEINNAMIENNKEQIAEIDKKLSRLTTQKGESDTDRVAVVREKLSKLDEFKKGLSAEITRIDEKRAEYIELIQKLSERKLDQEHMLAKVDDDIEIMQQRVQEEYGLDYTACLEYKAADFDYNAGSAEIVKLKRSIASLGNINIDAIEQCKVVYEEYSVLTEQKDDLEKAQADLIKIIKDLSDDMTKKFSSEFEKIRSNFVKIFKELFDGGNADLLLLENEDPLCAGIEIVAQPPQKKLQSISLLSGGERALTAIAILFAILRLRPMPFCVLDEIEAALDDANASRFAKYLRRFSEETQFIVITHRKPTMELADYLYGVTMEEKGVSKIVSVKLSEAVAHADKDKIGA